MQFLEFLDRSIGLSDVLVVLTADHGVCPLPEHAPVLGAARISGRDVLLDIKVRVGQEFNYNEREENVLQSLSNGFVYVNAGAVEEHRFDRKSFDDAIIRAALKETNIIRCYTRAQLERLLADETSQDTLGRPVAVSFDPERSGDIALVTAEYSFFSGGTTGTTHGSPYAYDRRVPLIFFGYGISRSLYEKPCRPNDIAPTIASILGLSPPEGSDGVALSAVIDH
jgi:predicted AlkP superfamily pyrophosphatase or phosphodiesterase